MISDWINTNFFRRLPARGKRLALVRRNNKKRYAPGTITIESRISIGFLNILKILINKFFIYNFFYYFPN